MTSTVYVSLGSNVDAENNIKQALAAMHEVFGRLSLSPVYESESVGFKGDNFLNLVAGLETTQDVYWIVRQLRQIEDAMGRDRSQPRFSKRPIDLDILVYDDLVLNHSGINIPRQEILQNSFVLRPLQDLAPERLHPLKKLSYAELWRALEPLSVKTEVFDLALDSSLSD